MIYSLLHIQKETEGVSRETWLHLIGKRVYLQASREWSRSRSNGGVSVQSLRRAAVTLDVRRSQPWLVWAWPSSRGHRRPRDRRSCCWTTRGLWRRCLKGETENVTRRNKSKFSHLYLSQRLKRTTFEPDWWYLKQERWLLLLGSRPSAQTFNPLDAMVATSVIAELKGPSL